MSRREEGIALVAVLWVTMLLSTIAAALVVQVRSHSAISTTESNAASAEALADAGVYHAIARLINEQESPLRLDGVPYQAQIAGRTVTITVQDELGKIDINAGNGEILARLLRAAGLDAREAAALVDRMNDWRDADDLRRVHGAEKRDYAARGSLYGPRNAPFRSLEELKLIAGVNEDLFMKVASNLTVYSHGDFIDPVTAPPAVLAALGHSTAQIEREVAERGRLTSNTSEWSAIASSRDSERAGRAFTIGAEVTVRERKNVVRTAVVRLTGDSFQPFWIQYWSLD